GQQVVRTIQDACHGALERPQETVKPFLVVFRLSRERAQARAWREVRLPRVRPSAPPSDPGWVVAGPRPGRGRRGGTWSSPPADQGLQRSTRQMASAVPLSAPCVRSAPIAYAEQLG